MSQAAISEKQLMIMEASPFSRMNFQALAVLVTEADKDDAMLRFPGVCFRVPRKGEVLPNSPVVYEQQLLG